MTEDSLPGSLKRVEGRRTELIVTEPGTGAVHFRAYRVRVVEGPDVGLEAPLERATMVVGTAEDADLRLSDAAVSRAHVKLVAFADGVEVQDLESKNGTFSGGMRLMRARLSPGTELTLGRTTLRLSPEDRPAELEPSERTRFGFLVGRSRLMRQLFSLLELVSKKDTPVLLEGEAGAGKTRAARSIHRQSPRATGRLHLIEGAAEDEARFAEPLRDSSGVVVVRHIDRLSPDRQRTLAQVLEEAPAPARVLATTCKDLEREAAAGRFDRGLLLRVGAVRARVPAVRERASDLPTLIGDLLEELGRASFELQPADLGRLQAYAWPENVRELRMVIERGLALESIRVGRSESIAPGVATDPAAPPDLPYKQARSQMIEAFEREYVRGLMATHEGNVTKAARAAGLDRVYLHRLIRKYDL